MADHLLLLIIFALCVSAVLAVLQRDTPRAQVRFGAALILGWLMYPFPL
jgi:uncharacterized MnhB-related membrane protein